MKKENNEMEYYSPIEGSKKLKTLHNIESNIPFSENNIESEVQEKQSKSNKELNTDSSINLTSENNEMKLKDKNKDFVDGK